MPIAEAELEKLMAGRGLSEAALAYIRASRVKPSRRPDGGRRSITVRYPSPKNGCSFSAESWSLEFSAGLTLEHDQTCLAYFEQPPPLKVSYRYGLRNRANWWTPDILAIHRDRAIIIECKPLARIERTCESRPGYFELTDDRWNCPPQRDAAGAIGLDYRLFTDADLNLTLINNYILLQEYFLDSSSGVSTEQMKECLDLVAQHAEIRLCNLLPPLGHFSPAVIFTAIATGALYVPLDLHPLRYTTRCSVFPSRSVYEFLHGRNA